RAGAWNAGGSHRGWRIYAASGVLPGPADERRAAPFPQREPLARSGSIHAAALNGRAWRQQSSPAAHRAARPAASIVARKAPGNRALRTIRPDIRGGAGVEPG